MHRLVPPCALLLTAVIVVGAMERKRKLELDAEDDGRKRSHANASTTGAANGNAPATPQINPYTGRAYSQRYYDILEKRQGGCAAYRRHLAPHVERLLII